MRRFEKAKDFLAKRELDAIIVSDEYNMHYLSGAKYEGFLYVSKNKMLILTDSRYTVVADRDAIDAKVITISMGETYAQLIANLVKEDKAVNVGFEDLHMTFSTYEKFNRDVDAKLLPVGEGLDLLRQIKDATELEYLETAEHIGDAAFLNIIKVIKPGMTEMEIAIELENHMKRNGADGLSFDTIVASGLNGSMPHAVPGQKKVDNGEFITMDFGCKYKGYCSDMTRTVFLGKANEEQRKIYNTVYEAQTSACDFIKAGVKGKDVDKVARDIIEEAGYGEYFGHGLGHSVGLFIHENPRLSPKEENIILENMIETIEPGIYIPNFGGVRIEDMVVVTKEGHINFASSPKELIEL